MELNDWDYEMLESCIEMLRVDGHGGLFSKLNMIKRKIKRDTPKSECSNCRGLKFKNIKSWNR